MLPTKVTQYKCKYLIMGGGAAGLTAAYQLKHHGKVCTSADDLMSSRYVTEAVGTCFSSHFIGGGLRNRVRVTGKRLRVRVDLLWKPKPRVWASGHGHWEGGGCDIP